MKVCQQHVNGPKTVARINEQIDLSRERGDRLAPALRTVGIDALRAAGGVLQRARRGVPTAAMRPPCCLAALTAHAD